MANLGFQAMYELFNNIPVGFVRESFLPDSLRGFSVEEHSSSARSVPNGGTEYSRNGSGTTSKEKT